MSKMIEMNLRPDARTLRQFGLIAVVGFGFLAAIAWYEVLIFAFGLGEARPIVAGVFLALAGFAGLASLVFPRANLPIYLGLTIVAFPIGFVLSYVIMGTLFYLMITPVGLIMKAIGRDPMMRGFEPEAATYWVDTEGGHPKERYFKQF